mgnify:CR=1 FL=1
MKNKTTDKIVLLEKKINDGIELTQEDYILLLTIKLLKTRNG